MEKNLIWQYAVVLLIILAALVRIILGVRRIHKNPGSGGCPGCSLSDTCQKRRLPLPTAQKKNPDKSGKCGHCNECPQDSGKPADDGSGHGLSDHPRRHHL